VLAGENPIETYVYQDTTRVNIGGILVVTGKGQNAQNTVVPFDAGGPFVPSPAAAFGGLGLLGLRLMQRRKD
jgi:hypothetical protein